MGIWIVFAALALQVASPGESACLGFIRAAAVPMNLYVSGTEEDELVNYSSPGKLLYLSGPGVASAKVGELYSVVRPEGRIRHPATGERIGIYHKELGSVRIEAVRPDGATAAVISACNAILKGDLLVPPVARPSVEFGGKPSDALTPYPSQGLIGEIVLGKDGIKEMGAGNICFLELGSRDGVKPGDRFTIYRRQPAFDAKRLGSEGSLAGYSYKRYATGEYRALLMSALKRRHIPPRVMGDLVVLDVQETTSAAKIIQSRSEIHVGDIVVRR